MSVNETMHDASTEPLRRVFVAGSQPGLFSVDAAGKRPLLRRLLALTGVPRPRVCFLGTAQGDCPDAIAAWYQAMAGVPADCTHLRLFDASPTMPAFADALRDVDIVFVGNGNTLNMLAVWRAQGLDMHLRAAWERGVILAGGSAGMGAWFTRCISDARPQRLSVVDGLGFLPFACCAHVAGEGRRAALEALLQSGGASEAYACEDAAALYFEGTRLQDAYSADGVARAYHLQRHPAGVTCTALPLSSL